MAPASGGARYPGRVPSSARPEPGRPQPKTASPVPVKVAIRRQSPPWVPAVMVAMFVLGLAWLVVYYLVGATAPVMSHLGAWNLLIGIGFIGVGFGISTQWR